MFLPKYSSNLIGSDDAEVEEDEEYLKRISKLLEENLDECVMTGIDFIRALVKVNEEYQHFKDQFKTCLTIRQTGKFHYAILKTEPNNYRFREYPDGTYLIYSGLGDKLFNSFHAIEAAVLKKCQFASFDSSDMRGNATDKQKKILKNHGYSQEDLSAMTKGQANDLITRIKAKQNEEPATGKQRYLLNKHGILFNEN